MANPRRKKKQKKWSVMDWFAVAVGGPSSTPISWDQEYIDSMFKVVPNKRNVPSISAVVESAIKKLKKGKKSRG